MRTVRVEELSVSGFLPFGTYADMIDPDTEKIGAPPVEFYRDMVQQDLGGASTVSCSGWRVEERARGIYVTEYHSTTGEGLLPLDGDVLIHVAPASPPGAAVHLDKLRVFRVPRGTMVVLRPGVWHHAPFVMDGSPAHVLVVLPERAYANDCEVIELGADTV